jgi:hypothetical protein
VLTSVGEEQRNKISVADTLVAVILFTYLFIYFDCKWVCTRSQWCYNNTQNNTPQAVPWLRRLAAGLPPRRPGFDPGSVHVGFVVDEVALGQVFPRALRFSPVNFIPPVLHY